MTARNGADGTKQVLLAEDDDDIRVFVSLILAKAGFETEAYSDGQSALVATRESAAALYLLDVRMPDVTGLELCRQLRASPRTRSSPILLISAESAEEDIAAGLAAGADDYLPKPFTRRELLLRIEQLLSRHPAGDTG